MLLCKFTELLCKLYFCLLYETVTVFYDHTLVLFCRLVSVSYGTFFASRARPPKKFWPKNRPICPSHWSNLTIISPYNIARPSQQRMNRAFVWASTENLEIISYYILQSMRPEMIVALFTLAPWTFILSWQEMHETTDST